MKLKQGTEVGELLGVFTVNGYPFVLVAVGEKIVKWDYQSCKAVKASKGGVKNGNKKL